MTFFVRKIVTNWRRSGHSGPTTIRVGGFRSFSTTDYKSHSNPSTPEFIPKPTWSIQSLDLTSQHTKLPREELERLSHLALLDLNELPEDLEQDLANMMHMVQQVSDFVSSNPILFEDVEEDPTGTSTYDFVRGVTGTPFRRHQEDTTELDDEKDDRETAVRVWDSYLEPNTIRQGGSHRYFAITTKTE